MSSYSQFLGGASINVQEFTSSGTWSLPSGDTTAFVEAYLIGAGGGGGGGGGSASLGTGIGGGGGGASSGEYKIWRGILSADQTLTIGAAGAKGNGGAAGANDGADGSDGGTTSLGTYAIALGGKAGKKGKGNNTNNDCGSGGDGGLMPHTYIPSLAAPLYANPAAYITDSGAVKWTDMFLMSFGPNGGATPGSGGYTWAGGISGVAGKTQGLSNPAVNQYAFCGWTLPGWGVYAASDNASGAGGNGGPSPWGSGGAGANAQGVGNNNGVAATDPTSTAYGAGGGGGSGAWASGSGGARAGGNGANGIKGYALILAWKAS